jgi:hypothetical protein
MNAPDQNAPDQTIAKPAPTNGFGRRIAASIFVGFIVFVVSWLMAFSLVASLLISAGCCVALVATSTVLELVATVLDLIATAFFAILAVVGAIVGAILALFVG